jgi:hypothetical protein
MLSSSTEGPPVRRVSAVQASPLSGAGEEQREDIPGAGGRHQDINLAPRPPGLWPQVIVPVSSDCSEK